MEWNKLTTRNIAEDEKEFFHNAIEYIWEGKLQKLMKKSLSIIQRLKIYTPIPGLIMEKELVLRTLMKT